MAKLKTGQELLAAFNKANKDRRAGIINRAGCKTEADYIKRLQEVIAEEAKTSNPTPAPAPVPVAPDATPVKRGRGRPRKTPITEPVTPNVGVSVENPTIHVVNLLDVSGSMSGTKLNNAEKGLNLETQSFKETTGVNYVLSLTAFDDRIMPQYSKKPVSEVPANYRYVGRNGTTALNRVICTTIIGLLNNITPNEKVLLNIFTDGHNEGDYSYSEAQTRDYIKRAETAGITVTFIGDARDLTRATKIYGFDESNTLAMENTAKGVEDAFKTKAAATASYTANVKAGNDVSRGFYKRVIN